MLTTTRWQLARLLPSRQQAGILVKMSLLSRLTARGMLSTRLSTGKRALLCSLARSLARFLSKQLTSMRVAPNSQIGSLCRICNSPKKTRRRIWLTRFSDARYPFWYSLAGVADCQQSATPCHLSPGPQAGEKDENGPGRQFDSQGDPIGINLSREARREAGRSVGARVDDARKGGPLGSPAGWGVVVFPKPGSQTGGWAIRRGEGWMSYSHRDRSCFRTS